MAMNSPWTGERRFLARDRVAQGELVDGHLAAHLGHLGVPAHLDLGVREGAVLHDLAAAERLAPHEHRHLRGEAGQEERLLQRGVAAAHHGDLPVAEEEAVAGGAGAHPAAAELLLGLQAEPQCGGAGGDDHGIGLVLVVAHPEPMRALAEVDPGHVLVEQLAAEALGLVAEELHQLRPLDARGEAGVVLHVRGDHQLAERRVAGEDDRLQVRAGRVDGGGQAGGPGPDDRELVMAGIGAVRSGVPVLGGTVAVMNSV